MNLTASMLFPNVSSKATERFDPAIFLQNKQLARGRRGIFPYWSVSAEVSFSGFMVMNRRHLILLCLKFPPIS